MNKVDIKPVIFSKRELGVIVFIYSLLLINALVFKDSPIAVLSAFFGVTYTVLAGKGTPSCYIAGVSGMFFYSCLAFKNALWGNLALYAGYYFPMNIAGYFLWKKNLKKEKYEIVKTSLGRRRTVLMFFAALIASLIVVYILFLLKDKNPVIDGITTVFSVAAMFLTVRRCIEQWFFWGTVNGLSFIMWLDIALGGEKVYSTVIMWGVYFLLAIYFYGVWKRDLAHNAR